MFGAIRRRIMGRTTVFVVVGSEVDVVGIDTFTGASVVGSLIFVSLTSTIGDGGAGAIGGSIDVLIESSVEGSVSSRKYHISTGENEGENINSSQYLPHTVGGVTVLSADEIDFSSWTISFVSFDGSEVCDAVVDGRLT